MAGSSIVGILKVLLTADTAEYTSAMSQVSREAANFSKQFNSIGRQMTQIGSAMTKTITLPLLAIGAGAVKAASDFESSFAGVRKTVDATEPEFEALAQGLRNMAKEIPVNVNELNRVAESAGQLGIKKDDIIAFTRTMADLGVTTNLTADEAATATAQIQNIFGAAGKDVDRFGATLVALGNSGASTEKDIINMGLRIAGAGHQIGMTQDQVLAFASALSSVGINAEAGGTTISRVFLKMNDAVMDGGEGLAEFARVAGMTSDQFKTAFQTNAAGAVVEFVNGLGRLKTSGENVNQTIEGLMGKSILIKDTLLRASGAGQLLNEQLQIGADAWRENTALTEEANKRYQTFASQLQLFWNQLRDVGIELGQALLPAMRSVVSIVQSFIPVLETLVQLFTALPTWVQGTALAFGVALAAAGPLIFAFGQISLAIGAMIGAFKAGGVATLAFNAVMSTAGVTLAGFHAAVLSVGPAVAIMATAFASWKLGGWIGDVTGLTDAFGKLTAKVGEYTGLLPRGTAAQYDASRAAATASTQTTSHTQALTQSTAAFRESATAAAAFVGPMQQVAAVTRMSKEDAKAAAKATKELQEAHERFVNSVKTDFYTASYYVEFKAAVLEAGRELQELASTLPAIAQNFVQFQGAVRDSGSAVEGWGATVRATMEALPTVIMNAIQGGGDVFRAAGAHIGTTLMASFSERYGELIKASLPFGIGQAVVALLPTLGALFGPVVERIAGFFRNIFGGPSAEELRGRQAVADFEAQLHSLLNQTQRNEAGNVSWKMTVIAIRDAYLAAGLSEEEAMRAAERLWASSRDGGEDTADVIDEIRRVINSVTSATVTLDATMDSTFVDRSFTVIENRQVNEDRYVTMHVDPADEGFGGGTLGRLGRWFGSFPQAGFTTALHGIEAVITPQQAPAFAMDVLAGMPGGGASSPMDFSGLETRMAAIERLLRDQPRHLIAAAQEAAVGIGGRRR